MADYVRMADASHENMDKHDVELANQQAIDTPDLTDEQDLMKYKQKHVTITQVIGGSVGNILEWYDFAVFGFLAQPIGASFFPSGSQTAEIIQAYGVFAGAFVARPVGGVLFGLLGDKMGRKLALQVSMVMMFVATFGMGCLPDYHTIGIAAPVILTFLRLFQGLSVGGQLVGSMLFLVESSKQERRGFYGSLVMMTATVGTMTGAWVASIFEAVLSHEAMEKWGWRIPFLMSFVIGIIGFITQHKMADSHEFQFASKSHQIIRNPLSKAVLKYWQEILIIAGVVAPWSGGFYITYLWLATYLEDERQPDVPHAFIANSFMFLWICACLLFGGWMSDKYTYFKTMKISAAVMIVLAIPVYVLVEFLTKSDQIYPMIVNQFVMGIMLGCFGGPMQIFMVDCVDDIVVRYCVMGVGYNLCQAIFGGTAPIFATLLAQGHLTLVGMYIALLASLALILLFIQSRKRQKAETVL